MSTLWISSADGYATNMRKAFDDTFGCVPEGFSVYTGGFNAVNNSFRLFGIDPVVGDVSHKTLQQRVDTEYHTGVPCMWDDLPERDAPSFYVVEYLGRYGQDDSVASWRFFL